MVALLEKIKFKSGENSGDVFDTYHSTETGYGGNNKEFEFHSFCSDIWHKYHEWYFETVIRNFTSR